MNTCKTLQTGICMLWEYVGNLRGRIYSVL